MIICRLHNDTTLVFLLIIPAVIHFRNIDNSIMFDIYSNHRIEKHKYHVSEVDSVYWRKPRAILLSGLLNIRIRHVSEILVCSKQATAVC